MQGVVDELDAKSVSIGGVGDTVLQQMYPDHFVTDTVHSSYTYSCSKCTKPISLKIAYGSSGTSGATPSLVSLERWRNGSYVTRTNIYRNSAFTTISITAGEQCFFSTSNAGYIYAQKIVSKE